jgi:hypothetical protein
MHAGGFLSGYELPINPLEVGPLWLRVVTVPMLT